MASKQDALISAQTSVLGSMIIDSRCVPVVMETIKEDYFTVGQYRTIFNAIRALAGEGCPIDAVTVLDRAGKAYADLIGQIITVTPTAANVREYCRILRCEARLQLLKDAAGAMLDAEDEDEIRTALDQVNRIMVDKPGIRAMNMAQALEDFYRRHDPSVKPDFLPWKFAKLNKYLRTEPGDLVYIGGYPSDGKTTLALHTAREQAKTKKVGFFSYETNCGKLADAMVCAAAQIGLPTIQLNKLGANEWDELAYISTDFTGRNLDIIEAAGMTVTDIRLYTMAHHYDVIYIDYVQLIPASGKSRWEQEDFQRVSANSRALKLFGLQCGVTIVALSQMTRPQRNKDGMIPPPTMSSLRSTGQIEQDADAVLLMFREDQKAKDADRIITFGKIKTGAAGGSFKLHFDGEMQTFSDKPNERKQRREEVQQQTQIQEFRELPKSEPIPDDFPFERKEDNT